MKPLKRCHFPFLLGALCISHFLPATFAGETIYELKDSNGTTLLTNKKNRYNTLKVEKKTYYLTVTFIRTVTGVLQKPLYYPVKIEVKMRMTTIFAKQLKLMASLKA